MELNSARHEKIYAGCCGQDFYIDITFKIEIRRKTLFYTVNLMIPCMMFGMWTLCRKISFFKYISAILTSIVFYVPPIEHKMTFSISILVTLTVFYLILIDLVPPTSLVIPLIGNFETLQTIVIKNWNFRKVFVIHHVFSLYFNYVICYITELLSSWRILFSNASLDESGLHTYTSKIYLHQNSRRRWWQW